MVISERDNRSPRHCRRSTGPNGGGKKGGPRTCLLLFQVRDTRETLVLSLLFHSRAREKGRGKDVEPTRRLY